MSSDASKLRIPGTWLQMYFHNNTFRQPYAAPNTATLWHVVSKGLESLPGICVTAINQHILEYLELHRPNKHLNFTMYENDVKFRVFFTCTLSLTCRDCTYLNIINDAQ